MSKFPFSENIKKDTDPERQNKKKKEVVVLLCMSCFALLLTNEGVRIHTRTHIPGNSFRDLGKENEAN